MVVTNKQREWLEKLSTNQITKRDDPHKYSVYMKRIRKTIDTRMENLLWIANNTPELLRDEEWEIQELGLISHRRLKILLQTVKALYPESDPQLVRLQIEAGLSPSYQQA